MTTRLDSLRALYDAVKAGTLDYDAFCPMWHQDGLCVEADNAYEGSLDAALALHNAVLPGWLMVEMSEGDESEYINNWVVVLGRKEDEGGHLVEGNARTPARSWLLAILSALIAQGEK